MASQKKFEDLDLSQDEIQRLSNALKNEEFRKLLVDYAEEISDPENKKRYEEEILQMEKERGMDLKFVHPEPGYVVKTTVDGDKKAFINICKNDNIAKPSSEKKVVPGGVAGLSWSIPHSFAPPRDDLDNHGKKCKVYDFVVHPDTYRMAETNVRFKQMLHDTAIDGIEKQFQVIVDRKNLKFPKINFKGTATPTVIRTRSDGSTSKSGNTNTDSNDILNQFPYPYDDKTTKEKSEEHEKEVEKKRKGADGKRLRNQKQKHQEDSEFTKPKYSIKHRSEFDLQDFRDAPDVKTSTRPTSLVVEIDLPILKSAANVTLDIFSKRLFLECSKPAKYRLDINLPYEVDENEGCAKFDKGKHQLVVSLPVMPEKLKATNDPHEKNNADNDTDKNCQSKTECDPVIECGEALSNGHPHPKPLIEVLPDTDPVPDNEQSDNNTKELMHHVPEEVDLLQQQVSGSALPCSDALCILAEYSYHQNDETVTFVLHIKNASRDLTGYEHCRRENMFTVKSVSVGMGGFPMHYSFCAKFQSTNIFEVENCRIDIGEDNLVFLLVKRDESLGLWDRFWAGLDYYTLEVCMLLRK